MLEWSDLRVFLAIAREGTLGAAARKLGQTQPTMGRRLRALEEAVGQTLFQRTAEGFLVTNAGASVLGHAERVEDEVLAFQRELAGQEGQLQGLLRLPPRTGSARTCLRRCSPNSDAAIPWYAWSF